jgi:hypothetical protein
LNASLVDSDRHRERHGSPIIRKALRSLPEYQDRHPSRDIGGIESHIHPDPIPFFEKTRNRTSNVAVVEFHRMAFLAQRQAGA